MTATVVEDGVNPTSDQSPQWLSFQISDQHYAVPLSDVSEVTREGELIPVPGAANDLLGLRQLRGRIVPVMDGRLRLHLSAPQVADASRVRLVMLCWGDHVVGLRVDAVGALIRGEVGDAPEPPSHNVSQHEDPVIGVLERQGKLIELLDLGQLFRMTRVGDLVSTLPLEHRRSFEAAS